MKVKIFPARDLAAINTFDDLIRIANKHQNKLSIVPAFAAKLDNFIAKRAELDAQSIVKSDAANQNNAIKVDVTAEKFKLAADVGNLVGPFSVYAEEEKDTKMSNILSNLTYTKLKKTAPLEMATNIQSFLNAAKELSAEKLAFYGIKQTTLDDLQTSLSHYQIMEPVKRTSNKDKPQQTTNFNGIIKELKVMKASMDKLVGGYKEAALEFWTEYTNSSVVQKSLPKAAKSSKKPKQTLVKVEKPKRKPRKSKNKDVAEVTVEAIPTEVIEVPKE